VDGHITERHTSDVAGSETTAGVVAAVVVGTRGAVGFSIELAIAVAVGALATVTTSAVSPAVAAAGTGYTMKRVTLYETMVSTHPSGEEVLGHHQQQAPPSLADLLSSRRRLG